MQSRFEIVVTVLVALVLALGAVVPAAADVQHQRRGVVPLAGSAPPIALLRERPADDLVTSLRLDPGALTRLRSASGRVLVDRVPLPDESGVPRDRSLSLERFAVATPGARIVIGAGVGAGERPASFDPSRMVHLRGHVVGEPASRVYLALAEIDGEDAVLGHFQIGTRRWVLGGTDPHRQGLGRGDLAIVPADGFGAPPLVDPCGAECCIVTAGDGAEDLRPDSPEGGIASFEATQRRLVRMAVDSDFEFFSLFGDEDEAAAYVFALIGAVSDIYLREFDAAVGVSYLRLWDAEEGLYNEPDPLYPFRAHWNETMGDVERDVAHLLTGRRNLPYGGVAWVSSLCTGNAYAVNGYLNGSFASASDPAGGNWDLVVVAHELGHNCGTLHTHDYGIDNCAGGQVRRGGIMSYCHVVSGGVSNIDLEFDTLIRGYVKGYLEGTACLWIDCDGNGVDDALDVMLGTHPDANGDGVPDPCQDCNGNGILDPDEIAMALAADINGNGIPDECEPDCNGNGVPDSADVGFGSSSDANGNGIPDECETDCDGDGVMDWLQIVNDMSLDVDRDGVLDACQDCDGDGVPDLAQLAGSVNVWVSGQGNALRQFNVRSGAPAVDGDTASLGGSTLFDDLLLAPDGTLLATHGAGHRVIAFDSIDGTFLGERIPASSGLVNPGTMLAINGGTMLITSTGNGRIVEYEVATGAFVRIVVPANGGVKNPFGMALHEDGALLVGSLDGSIQRFDVATGAHLGPFIAAGSGGLGTPRGLLTLPDGTLLVASNMPSALLRFDTDGAFIGRFDLGGNPNATWGLRDPWCMRMADDGARVLVTSRSGSTSVHSYGWPSGLFLRTWYVVGADLSGARGLAQMPRSPLDCNGNGILDACDIAAGRSVDLDGDGVPDECGSAPSADLDGDGMIDGADLGILLNSWGACPSGGEACPADLNGDGVVDGADLGILLNAWTT